MSKILIVEDEELISELMKMNLELVGHECEQVFDGLEAERKLQSGIYDLIIMDIMLPHKSGLELIKNVKDSPILFVTAKDNIQDKIKAFSGGAEDYIVKPFETLELIARVNVILRRGKKNSRVAEIAHIKVDLDGHKVYSHDELVEITPQEFGLLEALIINRNLALSREKLLEQAWDYSYEGDTRTVDVHIQKLRKKLGLDNYIKTVYKYGYRLEV